jgi:eukaryotic-like serine/threonine-protein kinase
VAVKVRRKRFSDNPAQYSQFIREGQLGMALRHPNIVPIFETYSKGGVHFLVMEFIEGQSLRDFVRVRRKLEPVEATRLAMDIAAGLHYGFEHGLTHRDLKMSNVLVSADGRAKIVDFGLAAIDDGGADEAGLGETLNARTIDYAALERATGVRKDDTRSDIYFLGCMYYHMLTGTPPLTETKDRVQRLAKQRFLDVVPIQKADPNLPISVAIVVNKAMMLEVNKRYQTPGGMLSDLQLVSRRLTEEAKAGGDSEDSRRERERLAAMLLKPQQQVTVMVVESNTRMQDVFRDALKKAGYRVILTSDPDRALGRLSNEQNVADCVVFCSQEIGESALAGFNRLGEDKRAHAIPAVLLLGENQRDWRAKAHVGEHRMVLSMPITLGQLRVALSRLIPTPEGNGQS